MSLCLKSQRNMTRFVFITGVLALVAISANAQQMMTFSEIAAKHNLKAPTLPPADVLFDSKGKVVPQPRQTKATAVPAEQSKAQSSRAPAPQPSQGNAPSQSSVPPQHQGFAQQPYPSPYQPYGQSPYAPNPYQPYGQTPYNPYGQPQPFSPYQPYGYPQPSPYGQYPPNPYQQNPYGQYPQVPYGYPQSNPYQPNPYQPNPYQSHPYQPQPNPYQPNPYQPDPNNPYAYPQPQPQPPRPVLQEEEKPPKQVEPLPPPAEPPILRPVRNDQIKPQQPERGQIEQNGSPASSRPQPTQQTSSQQTGQQPQHGQSPYAQNGTPAHPRPQDSQQTQQTGQPRQNGQSPYPVNGTPANSRYAYPREEQPQRRGVQKFTKPDGCSYECDVDVQDPVCGLLPEGSGHSYSNQCLFEGENKCFPGAYIGSKKGSCFERYTPKETPTQRPQQTFPERSQKDAKEGMIYTYKPNGCSYECEAVADPVCAITPDGKKNYRLPSLCMYEGDLKCDPGAYIGYEKGECKSYGQGPPSQQEQMQQQQQQQQQQLQQQRQQQLQHQQHMQQPQQQSHQPTQEQIDAMRIEVDEEHQKLVMEAQARLRERQRQRDELQKQQHQQNLQNGQDPNSHPKVQAPNTHPQTSTNGRYAMPAQPEQPRPQGIQTYTKSDGCTYQCDPNVRDPVCGVLIIGPGGHDYGSQCMFEGEHKCFPGTYSGFRKGSCNDRFEQESEAELPPKKIMGPNGCEFECAPVIRPVCAVRDDGQAKTFKNSCELDGVLKCSPDMQRQIHLVLTGDCKDIPASKKLPLTERHAANAANNRFVECMMKTKCPQPQPTMCAQRADLTFVNINACELEAAKQCDPKKFTNISYEGHCSQDPPTKNNAPQEEKDEEVREEEECEQTMCPMVMDPVCGVSEGGEIQDFGNRCQLDNYLACNPKKSFVQVLKGSC